MSTNAAIAVKEEGTTITNGVKSLNFVGAGVTATTSGDDVTVTVAGGGGSGTVTSVAALTLGTSGTDLSSTVANSTTTPVITLNVPTASATNRGALSSADWTTFNNKGSGTVTSVTGTSPVVSSGGATPAISLTSGYGDTLNPYASKTANFVLAAPNGSAGVPTFRAIVAADIPTLNQNTTGTAAGLSATLVATSGGTGQSSYAVGDLLYASTTTALSKLADVATGNALISGGVGVAPSWGKVGLTTHVSGTLPTANGGTNLTSFTSGGVVYASSTSALTTGSGLVFDGANLGVGVTPSAQYSTVKALQVGVLGATIVTGQTVAGGTSSFGQNWYLDPTTANYFYAAASSQPATRYSQSAGQHQWFYASAGTAGNNITFNQAMTLNASGGLQTLNTISVGNATPSTSGAGITFPATQSASTDANTLDDYEEGTWTPTLGGNTTYSTRTGTYVKIGRLVTLNAYLAVTSIGTGSTTQITGIPFTAASGGSGVLTAEYTASLATAIVSITAFVNSNQIDISSRTAAATSASTNAIFGNGTGFEFTCTYIATA
jgi:hypothetical protein